MISKEFVLAGKAIFTVYIPAELREKHDLPSHYTFRVNKKEDEGKDPIWFASLLTGPNNLRDYTYMAVLEPDPFNLRLTGKSAYKQDSWPYCILKRILKAVWEGRGQEITDNGWDVNNAGYCGKCGAVLTTPESIESGFGPVCDGRIHEESVKASWTLHNNVYIAEASDLQGGGHKNPRCPQCNGAVMKRHMTRAETDPNDPTEIRGWNYNHPCGATIFIIND